MVLESGVHSKPSQAFAANMSYIVDRVRVVWHMRLTVA